MTVKKAWLNLALDFEKLKGQRELSELEKNAENPNGAQQR